MMYNIVAYPTFERELKKLAKKYKSLKEDYAKLLADLTQNPMQGAALAYGLRKVRMQIKAKGKGKNGGARVITFIADIDQTKGEIRLCYIYDKSNQATISDKELLNIAKYNGLI